MARHSVPRLFSRSAAVAVASRALGQGLVVALALLIFPAPAGAAPGRDHADPRGRYLIVLRDSAMPRDVAAEHSRRFGAEVELLYQHALRGYSALLSAQALGGIQRDPRVAYVEADQKVEITSQLTPTGVSRIFAPSNPTIDIDGSDDIRIDADVAILDTGVDNRHPDLHVVSTADCTASTSLGFCVGDAGADDNGHGTHVAGSVAAIDNGYGVVGVAPGARLHSMKVLSATGDGLLSWAIAGIDRITALADTIEVANMSLGCECRSETLDKALARSVERGVVYVVAAGNSNKDARAFTPANHPDVVSVSALADFDGRPGGEGASSCRTDTDDTLADFSNWGSSVDIAAPGVCVLSTSLNGGYRTLSGTSMASPHVAGAAAIITSGANDPRSRADVAAVRDLLVASGNLGWFDDSGDSIHEPLLETADSQVFAANSPQRTLGSTPPAAQNQPPLASFVYSCERLSCHFDGTGSSDPDGGIAAYAWDFGDGTTASTATTTKTFASSGAYQVQLTVTDDGGQTSKASQEISVDDGSAPAGDGGDFRLSITAVSAGGTTTVTLNWDGTDRAGSVVVYRNGEVLTTTADDGNHTDIIRGPSQRLVYRICEEGTTRCSNEATAF